MQSQAGWGDLACSHLCWDQQCGQHPARGARQGTAPGARLSAGWRSGLPLGQFGSAWLGHGSHPFHIRRFLQQQGEPDAPQSAALGWEQQGWESRVSLRSMQELLAAAPRAAPLLQLLDKPPWLSCSHRCNTPGVPWCEGTPSALPKHRQDPSGCWDGVSEPSVPQGWSGDLPTCPQLCPGMEEPTHIPWCAAVLPLLCLGGIPFPPSHLILLSPFGGFHFLIFFSSLPSSGITSHAALTAEVTQTC